MMIESNSKFIFVRPRTWIDDIKDRFPHLFRDIAQFNFAVDEGWKEIITSLCEKLDALRLPDLKVVQVKEKFGGLRFYVHDGNDEADALIRQAMEESNTTCEWCGAPGKHVSDGWILTLCESCQAKRKENAR